MVMSSRLVDISRFRPVPDHQEVFSDVDTDQSLIVELLGFEADKSNTDNIEYCFRDLAAANDAEGSATVLSMEELDVTEALPLRSCVAPSNARNWCCTFSRKSTP